ncbi:putative flagellin, partial [Vibrio parahaemolyticus V-223/04]
KRGITLINKCSRRFWSRVKGIASQLASQMC